jgi:putative ABC transport system permease protein
MPGLFFTTALRNVLRHKVQSLINIASLALGLAIFGFTFLYVKQELSYDRSWPDAPNIHRLVIEQSGIPGVRDGAFSTANPRVYPQVLEYFGAQIDKSTRLASFSARFKDSASRARRNLFFVDPEFQDIFQLEVVAGDLRRALSGPGFIAIEENYAATLDSKLVPGDRVVLQAVSDVELEYEVAAIYRLPELISPSLRIEQLTLIHDYSLPLFDGAMKFASWEDQIQIWLTLKPNVDTVAFNKLQSAFVDAGITDFDQALGTERNISDHLFYRWQPVTAMHFNPVTFEAGNRAGGAGDSARVVTFAIVGMLVLLVGCSNSVSLSLASAMERRREVGICKAIGALPKDIMRQHLGEAVLLALLALVPAIAMLELLLPAYQNLLPFSADIDTGWEEYLLLALITSFVGLANGVYPALMLSTVKPQAVLQAGPGKTLKSGLSMRSLLVVSQFCFASMLLIGTAALYLQLAITRAQPLGFDPANLATLILPRMADPTPLQVELQKIPGVVQVVPVFSMVDDGNFALLNANTLVRERGDSDEITGRTVVISYGFFEVMRIPLLAGRVHDLLRDKLAGQAAETGPAPETPIVLNRSAARALGFASPEEAVEQIFFMRIINRENGVASHSPMRIIGIVEDNMYGSLRRKPGPEIYLLSSSPGSLLLMLRYEEAIENSLQERIHATAHAVNGQTLQDMIFVKPRVDSAFIQEQNESRLLLICGGLALLLACIGLYGLAAFAIERRVKEVGVRKVMGASVLAIVALYLWRFSRPVLIANLLAWPFAIYFVLQWIERFPYQLEKAWLLPLCVGAMCAVLMISLLTVSIITFRAAAAKPVQSLRYE